MRTPTLLILSGLAMPAPFLLAGFGSITELLSHDFGSTQELIKYGSAVYLVGFVAMTALHGMYFDSIGRRTVMLWSLGAHTLAAIGVALAPSAQIILLLQAVLGLAAGSGAVIGRALVQERLAGADGQRASAYLMSLFGLAAATAPIVADCLALHFGWRAIFWTLAGFGMSMFLAYYRMMPETRRAPARRPRAWKESYAGYMMVLRHPKFLWLVVSFAVAFNGFAIYLEAAMEVITERLALPQVAFIGLLIALLRGAMIAIAVLAKSPACPKPATLLKAGYVVVAAGASLSVFTGQMNSVALVLAVVPLVLYATGLAMITISSATMSLDFFPEHRGVASAMQTIIQTLIIAGATVVAKPILEANPETLVTGMILTVLVGVVSLRRSV